MKDERILENKVVMVTVAAIIFSALVMLIICAGCSPVRPTVYQALEMDAKHGLVVKANEDCQQDANDCPGALLTLAEFFGYLEGVDMDNNQRQALNENLGGVLVEIKLQDPNTMQKASDIYTQIAGTWIERAQ